MKFFLWLISGLGSFHVNINYFDLHTFNFNLTTGPHCFDYESTYKMIPIYRN